VPGRQDGGGAGPLLLLKPSGAHHGSATGPNARSISPPKVALRPTVMGAAATNTAASNTLVLPIEVGASIANARAHDPAPRAVDHPDRLRIIRDGSQ